MLFRHEDPSTIVASRSRSPLEFFALIFALSIPFWLSGTMTRQQLLPGLPVGALMAFCPGLAASILVYRESGPTGVSALLRRAFDYERIGSKVWYVPIVVLMPVVSVLSYVLMRWMRMPLPTPQFSVLAALAMSIGFFVGSVGEEVGWSGYITDSMQRRWNALHAAILLGVVWAVWHIVPLEQAHRSAAWIAWWCLGTVGSRVIIVWLYNNTGKSVFATVLYHTILNLCWQLFPNYGSHYDPRITSPLIALAAATVAVVWGPRSLARLGRVSQAPTRGARAGR